jgi:UDP-N-acetylmuramate: L-alanyl-gamma-D-glutamyl-meso-diaminopimelate ligase
MGGIAALARELGFEVSGSDEAIYPPMSDQLERLGIEFHAGYRPEHLQPAPDLVVVGNALSRGNPAIEYLLNNGIRYCSGPQWLSEHILGQRWVLAVSGTHGKTTTTSMLAWILHRAGRQPGFLIGGMPRNFDLSARVGGGGIFVVEADEYDTAFFDKRSKFVHYRPTTLVINNLEHDHADIFPDLAAIQRQFHHLIRTIPGKGRIIRRSPDLAIDELLAMGCWSSIESFSDAPSADWSYRTRDPSFSRFDVLRSDAVVGSVAWDLIGSHNAHNATAAVAAAAHAGVETSAACRALSEFKGVKRRLELVADVDGIRVYDDFAHHPTAIAMTLASLRASASGGRIIAVLEPRSNTMRMGSHRQRLAPALESADRVFIYEPPGLSWNPLEVLSALGERVSVHVDHAELLESVLHCVTPGDHVVVMSNGSFGGFTEKLRGVLDPAWSHGRGAVTLSNAGLPS